MVFLVLPFTGYIENKPKKAQGNSNNKKMSECHVLNLLSDVLMGQTMLLP